jgi:hypothetical protein
MSAPWAELFPELVREIARCLEDPEDRAWMRAVCKKWHAADPDFRLPEPVRRALLQGHARASARQWLTLCDGPLFRRVDETMVHVGMSILMLKRVSWLIVTDRYTAHVSITHKRGDLGFCSLWEAGADCFICAGIPAGGTTLATWFTACGPEFLASLTPLK